MQYSDFINYFINNILYNLNQTDLQQMGVISSSIKKDSLPSMHHSHSDKLQHSKMFQQNSKTQEVFMKQIERLCKKVSYVPYPWAQNLYNYLTLTDPHDLYSEYQDVLSENCRRDDKTEIIFHALKLRFSFLQDIHKRYKIEEVILNVSQIKRLIYQVKCYFMVMSWLHKIASLDEIKSKSYDQDSSTYLVFVHEEKVYNCLIEEISKTFSQHIGRKEPNRFVNQLFFCSPEFQNCEVMELLKQIQRHKHFHERQKLIISLQKMLKMKEQSAKEYYFWIEKIFGKNKIFSFLLVMKQLGSLESSYLWRKFFESSYDQIFECHAYAQK